MILHFTDPHRTFCGQVDVVNGTSCGYGVGSEAELDKFAGSFQSWRSQLYSAGVSTLAIPSAAMQMFRPVGQLRIHCDVKFLSVLVLRLNCIFYPKPTGLGSRRASRSLRVRLVVRQTADVASGSGGAVAWIGEVFTARVREHCPQGNRA